MTMQLRATARVVVASALIVTSATGSVLGKPTATPPTTASSTSASAPVAEEAPGARAAKLRTVGNEAMIGLQYADALAAYEQAFALTPDDATLLYNIARARQLLGDFPEALTSLEQFDAKATAEQRARVGKLDTLYAQLRPRVSQLVIDCDVKGARVLVRDRVVGVTPLAPLRTTSGAATVSIELDGHFTDTRDVSLPGGGSVSLQVRLRRKSDSGLISVKTEPLGADVTIDGKPGGTTTPKIELALPAGPHELIARRDGYDEARVPFVLAPGATRDLNIPMSKSLPITSRWWFWTSIGVVVVGGVALGIVLTTEKPAGHGSLTPGQVSGPLVRF